jgi:hypothetical protein
MSQGGLGNPLVIVQTALGTIWPVASIALETFKECPKRIRDPLGKVQFSHVFLFYFLGQLCRTSGSRISFTFSILGFFSQNLQK